ncbi:MAG TPA: hypothetical protein H9827_12400 [Candidatus Luteimonas excrementigallinarum]|nr:hypothetical protein [Candidatus Luteimonas excrementigallinarum]
MKIRIYKPHTHAGRRYTPGPEGMEIEVSKSDAAYLERAGITVPAVAAEGTGAAKALPAAGDAPALADQPAAEPQGFGSTTTRPARAGKQ